MNILIKLMSIVSLVIAPTLAQMHTKKVETPVMPMPATPPQGKVIKINEQPIAKINTDNTVQYQ